jgi:DNA (cytosine-5)-methyltransferase 1
MTREYKGIVLERLKHLPPSGKMGDLPPALQHESYIRKGDKKTGGPNMRLLRLEMDKPSLTVTAYIFNKFVHPAEPRYITSREAACLQDFPIDWIFEGSLYNVQHQVGNAVPVLLAEAMARSVSEYLYSKNYRGRIPIVSYFCGAGGLDLGFEKASNEKVKFETVFCTDIDAACGNTIQRNREKWNFYLGDITKFDADTVLDITKEKPILVIGGPPCQPFSVAGKQKATKDPLGTLYRNYIKHISTLNPEIVIMENVYGLAQVKNANMIKEIYQAFKEIGYNAMHEEILAANFGTPQMRRRIFFIATKGINTFRFPYPTHCEQGDLFGALKYNGAGNSFANLPPPTIVESKTPCKRKETIKYINYLNKILCNY